MSKTLEKEVQDLRQKTIIFQEENTHLKIHLKTETEKHIQAIKTLETALLESEEKAQQSIDAAEQRFQEAEEKAKYYELEYERIRQAYLQAQRARFGKKSERFVDDTVQQQTLFDSPDSTADQSDKADTETITYTRKIKGTKKPDISLIPTREVIIAVSEEDRICRCGYEKEVIGYESSKRLNYQPAVFEMVIEKREKVACRKGCGSVITAPLIPRILPKCKVVKPQNLDTQFPHLRYPPSPPSTSDLAINDSMTHVAIPHCIN